MINKESIISAFTDRCTLLKWLKKVEAALKDSVLDDVAVNQISETQVQLEFKFADGTSTLSPVLTLPKGDKGDPGEPGKDGLDGEGIAATVEVGTVTTGAPGSEARVTNSGTDQRAILNFVIPRGDPGSEGSAGAGFDDATLMEFNQSAEVILGTQGFTAEGYTKVTAGAEIFEIPSKMIIPVGGSESIIVDVNDTGTAIEIHLEAEILAKINRALLLPTSAPASVSLVAVDTNNAQSMLTLGDGLSVSDGVISASGGGGTSESGTKLYRHRFTTARGFKYDAICNRAEAGRDTSAYVPAAYSSRYPSQMTLALYINDGLCVQAKENSDYILQFFYYNGTTISIAASTGDMPESTGEVEVIEL